MEEGGRAAEEAGEGGGRAEGPEGGHCGEWWNWGRVVSAAAGFGGGGLGVVGGYPAVAGTAAVGVYTHPSWKLQMSYCIISVKRKLHDLL